MIGRAIDSVLAQTYTNWELVIVDDGSTDNTKQFISTYTDVRVRYIYQQNAERSAARNNGIDNSKGQYICFIDSDDYFLPNHLEVFYSNIVSDTKADMFFGLNVVDKNGVLTEENSSAEVADYNSIEEFMIVNPIRVAAVCIKKEALLTNKFDTTVRIGEDTELWMKIAEKHTIKAIKSFTQVYFIHEGQSVENVNQLSFVEQIYTLKKIYKEHKNANKISRKIKNLSLAYSYFRIGQIYFFQGKYKLGLKNMILSSWYIPFFRIKTKLYLALYSKRK